MFLFMSNDALKDSPELSDLKTKHSSDLVDSLQFLDFEFKQSALAEKSEVFPELSNETAENSPEFLYSNFKQSSDLVETDPF